MNERALNLLYALTPAATDRYTPIDVETVKRLQAKFGLLVDGKVGPQTWAAFIHELSTVG